MAEQLSVVITAKDGASRVFKEVGNAAGDVGTQAERAGEQGERGFRRIGDSAENARVSTEALSVGLTALGAGLSYAGAMAMQQERQIIALNRAFGDTADEILRFSEELDDLTIFSDDDIRAGQRFFATLQNNYDLSIDQIRELMTVTAELAAASGVSFENASSRVTAAIRGEGEAIEWLGLTMNQQSIDRENLTLSMTNQEAAQFRLNALFEQSAPYIGTNNDLMNKSVGIIAEWQDKMQDAGAAVGNVIGPVGTLTTGLGTLGIGMTGLATGANVLGKALPIAAAGARTLWAALGPIGVAVAGISIAVPVLSGLFGDSGDAMDDTSMSADELSQSMAGLNAIIKETSLSGDFFLAGQMRTWVDDSKAALGELDAEIAHHTDTWNSMITDGLRVGEGWNAGDVGTWITGNWGEELEQANLDGVISDYIYNSLINGEADALSIYDWGIVDQWMDGLLAEMIPDEADAKRVSDAMAPIFELMTNPAIDSPQLAENYQAIWDSFDDHGSVDRLVSDLEALEEQTIATHQASQLFADGDYYRMLGEEDIARAVTQLSLLEARAQGVNSVLSSGEQRAYAESWEGINEAIAEGSSASNRIIGELTALESQLNDGLITQEQYAQGVVDIYLNIERYEQDAISAAVATNVLTLAMQGATQATEDQSEAQIELNLALGEAVVLTDKLETASARGASQAADLAAEMARIRSEGDSIGSSASTFITPFVEDAKALEETLAGILDLTGDGDFLSQWNMTSAANEATRLAENLNDASAALDTTYRVIVGNTNAIANQVDGIHSWAEELINVEGTYGEIDRLLQQGLITQEQYNDAQLAYNDIAAANLQIQDDVLAIQAQQAPLIAQQTTNMADYVEQIRQMNDGTVEGATRQLEALSWMDEGLQNQAMNVALFADSLDDLGAGGEAAFAQMVESIEATNPALFTMLETMGYVSNVVRDENGKVLSYDINLDGADGAMSEIERLTMSIDALIVTLGGVPPSLDIDVTDNTAASIGRFQSLQMQVAMTDATTASIDVFANDYASGTLQSLAYTWGGTIATSYVDIITRNFGGNAMGGVVHQYAKGGVLTELAEAGPEVLHFATGGTAYVGQRGVYSVEPGTYVSPNNAVSNSYGGHTFNITVNGADAEYVKSVVVDAVIPPLIAVMDEERRTAGVA